MINPKVYFVGASGVGKTTLAQMVHERFGLPLLSGMTAKALEHTGLDFAKILSDVEAADAYQSCVWRMQLESEAVFWNSENDGFVSDRGFDILAYTAILSRVAWKMARSEELSSYIERIRRATMSGRCVVFFVRPHPEVKAACDGRRDWFLKPDVVGRVDGIVEWLLWSNEIPHVVVRDPDRRDRLASVESIVALAKKR